jgi:nucleolar protein 56
LVHQDLLNFLDAQLPKKKKKVLLGVGDSHLAASIAEQMPAIRVTFTGVVGEIMRGIRAHFSHLSKGLPHAALNKAQLALGHCYSRSKVVKNYTFFMYYYNFRSNSMFIALTTWSFSR